MAFRINPKNPNCVDVKRGERWVKKGCATSPQGAKEYLKACYAHQPKGEKKSGH